MDEVPKDIVMQAAEGNLEAFHQIYEMCAGFVYSITLRIVGNEADAQEVTQDIFLRIHKSLKKFSFKSSFKTWVYRIATNTAINVYRKNARQHKKQADYEITERTTPHAHSTQQDLQHKENERSIMALLAKLNADQRACIILREVEGLSYQEIAQALNININTVRSRLKRARLALLAHVRKEVISHEL